MPSRCVAATVLITEATQDVMDRAGFKLARRVLACAASAISAHQEAPPPLRHMIPVSSFLLTCCRLRVLLADMAANLA